MAQTQWPDRHKVLKHLTEAELQRYGMLELDNAQRPSLTNAVHPIFRHANWVNVRLAHQTQLRPSLRLASHFLTSPQLLPFWHTLLFGQRLEVPRHVAVGPNYGHTLYSFHRIFDVSTSSFALSTLDIERTLDALVDLAGSVTFTINREPASLSAVLLTWRNFDSAPPNGFGGAASLVMVDRRFLDAYAELDVSVSQRLRLQFEIAVGLTHELAHVVENAVNPMLPRSPSRQDPNDWDDSNYPDEPFFERDRIAECGHAWESCVLGGRTYFWGDAEFPYGLVMAKWPDLEFRSELPTRAKPKRWSTVYFLSVEYIQALFTDKFWSNEGIGRYGAGEVKFKKTYGWREYNQGDVNSDDDEGISWGDSSRGRVPDSDGVIRPAGFVDPSYDPFQFIDWTAGDGGAGEVDAGGDTVME